jgi:hypothetical protein
MAIRKDIVKQRLKCHEFIGDIMGMIDMESISIDGAEEDFVDACEKWAHMKELNS